MDFIKWLKEFKDVDRPIGDLAKDILNDEDFPDTNERVDIYEYLVDEKGADYKVISVFEDVWKAYKMLI